MKRRNRLTRNLYVGSVDSFPLCNFVVYTRSDRWLAAQRYLDAKIEEDRVPKKIYVYNSLGGLLAIFNVKAVPTLYELTPVCDRNGFIKQRAPRLKKHKKCHH